MTQGQPVGLQETRHSRPEPFLQQTESLEYRLRLGT